MASTGEKSSIEPDLLPETTMSDPEQPEHGPRLSINEFADGDCGTQTGRIASPPQVLHGPFAVEASLHWTGEMMRNWSGGWMALMASF